MNESGPSSLDDCRLAAAAATEADLDSPTLGSELRYRPVGSPRQTLTMARCTNRFYQLYYVFTGAI